MVSGPGRQWGCWEGQVRQVRLRRESPHPGGLANRSTRFKPSHRSTPQNSQQGCVCVVGLVGVRQRGAQIWAVAMGGMGIGGSRWCVRLPRVIVVRFQTDVSGRPQCTSPSLRPLHGSAASQEESAVYCPPPQRWRDKGGSQRQWGEEGGPGGWKLALGGFEGSPGVAWFRTAPRQTYWLQ